MVSCPPFPSHYLKDRIANSQNRNASRPLLTWADFGALLMRLSGMNCNQRRISKLTRTPLLCCLLSLLTGCTTAPKPVTLQDVYALLHHKQFVDLTHAFEPGIPHWPGLPDELRETLYSYEPGKGKLGA